MGILFLLLLIAGGVVTYRYLTIIEAEIRAEIAAKEQAVETTSSSESSTELNIVHLIKMQPGILQTDIYKEFPDIDRKQLQKELLNLDRSGKILRKKSGSTYQLSSLD